MRKLPLRSREKKSARGFLSLSLTLSLSLSLFGTQLKYEDLVAFIGQAERKGERGREREKVKQIDLKFSFLE